MEIFKHKDNYLKIFSLGVEVEYKGTSIVYNDNKKTLLYFYYPNFKKLYILDGKNGNENLANVNEKVRIIAIFVGREVYLFTKYMKNIIKTGELFNMSDDFFIDLIIILKDRSPKYSDIMLIYKKHKDLMIKEQKNE